MQSTIFGVKFQDHAVATSFAKQDNIKNGQSPNNVLLMTNEEIKNKALNNDLKIAAIKEDAVKEVLVKSAVKEAIVKESVAIEAVFKEEIMVQREELIIKKEKIEHIEVGVREELEISSLRINSLSSNKHLECSAMLALSLAAAHGEEERKSKKQKIENKVVSFTVSNESVKLIDMINSSSIPSPEEEQTRNYFENKECGTDIDSCLSPSTRSPQNIVQICSIFLKDNVDTRLKSSDSDDQDLMKDANLLHSFKTLLENTTSKQSSGNKFDILSKKTSSSTASVTYDFCLIPNEIDRQKLSDYNNLLTQNIQMFLVDINDHHHQHSTSSEISHVTTEKLAHANQQRIGLRCMHCVSKPYHAPGATYFPRNIASLSSGLGTISARHILTEKCPFVPNALVEQLRTSKKNSQSQTRKRGMCLDLYCKDILTRNLGLISYIGIKQSSLLVTPNNAGKQDIGQIDHIQNHGEKTDSEEYISQSFQPSSIENFWECKNCISIPYPWRASYSVVFSDTAPSNNLIQKHLKVCRGKTALAIPRTASIHILDNDCKRISIKWDGSDYRKSDLHNQCSSGAKELLIATDKNLTTEFACYIFLQLKITHLTKTGGSRGSCPVGYPGLACLHCSNMPNERTFFYTSPDHLRNSFSHIPSHLMECAMCPEHVKSKLECLKVLRNKQKSLLKLGSHKMFIDRVWERMHGSSSRKYDEEGQQGWFSLHSEKLREKAQDLKAENELVYDSTSATYATNYLCTKLKQLVSPDDKHLVTDYTYFTMQQMIPSYLTASGNGARSSFEVGFPGLECCHCSNTANARRFFYRTSDILGGNYAHIPNHLMACKSCPSEVKATLEAKKLCHLQQKMKLGRGSQRIFFGRVWDRLHGMKRSDADFSATTDKTRLSCHS